MNESVQIEIRDLTKIYKLNKKADAGISHQESEEDCGRSPDADGKSRRDLRTSGAERGREDDDTSMYRDDYQADVGRDLCEWQ